MKEKIEARRFWYKPIAALIELLLLMLKFLVGCLVVLLVVTAAFCSSLACLPLLLFGQLKGPRAD